MLRIDSRTYIAVAALASACAGCGHPEGFYPVSGKVLYRGEPASGAAVYFHSRGPAVPDVEVPSGVVEPDGTFRIASGEVPGALAGSYDVLIEWRDPSASRVPVTPVSDRGRAKGRGKAAPAGPRGRLEAHRPPDRLKGRYFNPDRPLLTAEVKPGTNTLPDFVLSD
jgi:hypothetical protein